MTALYPEDALRAYLLADPAIAALVGDRIEPEPLTQGSARPALTYKVISVLRHGHLEALGALAEVRLQVDIWADTRAQARSLFDLVRRRLHEKTAVVDGFEVQKFEIVLGPRDFYEPDVKLRRISTDVMVFHTEAA